LNAFCGQPKYFILLDGYCAYYVMVMVKVASCSMLLNLQTLAILHTSEPPFHLHNTLLYSI
jgi:hypothetical protein